MKSIKNDLYFILSEWREYQSNLNKNLFRYYLYSFYYFIIMKGKQKRQFNFGKGFPFMNLPIEIQLQVFKYTNKQCLFVSKYFYKVRFIMFKLHVLDFIK